MPISCVYSHRCSFLYQAILLVRVFGAYLKPECFDCICKASCEFLTSTTAFSALCGVGGGACVCVCMCVCVCVMQTYINT